MKIYIMTDMEGASGLRLADECSSSSPLYEPARSFLIDDANAAIAGCFDGGAEEVTVNDGHGPARTLDMARMDKRAAYESCCGSANVLPALDETYDGLVVVGAHAMAGTVGAFLDHTQSSVVWHDYYINGERYGEIGQWAAIAGHYDVPLLFVAGDRAACEEAERQFPGCATVAVKEAVRRNYARITLPPERAHEAIREGARKAMALAGKLKPWKLEPPVEIKLEFNRADYADTVARNAGVERLDARTVRRMVSDVRRVVQF